MVKRDSLVLNHETSALLWVRTLLLEDEPNTALGGSRRRVICCHQESLSLRQVFSPPDTWQLRNSPKIRMLGEFSCCLPSPMLPPAHLEELLDNKGALDWDVPKLQSAARGNRGGGRSVLGANGLMGTKQPACPSVEAPSPYGIPADCKCTWAVPPPALAVPQLPLLCPASFSLRSSVLTPHSLFASLLQTLHLPNSLHVRLYRGVTKTWYKDIGIFTLFPFFLFSHLFT